MSYFKHISLLTLIISSPFITTQLAQANDIIASKIGKKAYNKGVYVGELLDGQPDGRGAFYYYNGDNYKGFYKTGKRRGCGVFTFKKTGKREKRCYSYGTRSYNKGMYEGELMNGRPHGQGVFRYSKNYDRYEGNYYRGKRHGIGIYYYNSGGSEKRKYQHGDLEAVYIK